MKNQTDIKQLRAFGLMVGGIFTIIGSWPVIFRSEGPRVWAVALGSALIILGLWFSRSLRWVYRIWMNIGHALGWVNTRIILGILHYGLLTPMGVVRRFVLGKDSMRRGFDPAAESYRVSKKARPSSHMRHQF